VWGARAELLPRAARRLQPAQLEAALLHAARVDRVIKGVGRGDAWDELLQLALRLMPAAPESAPVNRGRISASR
jgi:DNA polymerase-3 subunit delta